MMFLSCTAARGGIRIPYIRIHGHQLRSAERAREASTSMFHIKPREASALQSSALAPQDRKRFLPRRRALEKASEPFLEDFDFLPHAPSVTMEDDVGMAWQAQMMDVFLGRPDIKARRTSSAC